MKLIQTLVIIGILLMSIGCQIKESEETSTGIKVTLTADELTEKKGYCALTATADGDGYLLTLTAPVDRDDYFLIIDELFTEGIPCNTNDDCYDFLIEQDGFPALAPEFHAYLSCEDVEEPIVPNKIKA